MSENKIGKKVILVDGNSLMFRSYYATAYSGNLMKTKDGQYTNALFGFCNMMNKLLDPSLEYMFVAFDAGKQTFRHQQYKEYKGTRKPLPEELREQIPLIKKYLQLMNIKMLESLDYEADDLIATVGEKIKDQVTEILVITGDHDLLQLVSDKISVGLTKKGVGDLDLLTNDNFFEKMGMFPWQIIEYKGIVGDTSDNLPGIKGIGEKTALKLLGEYKTIEGIYENVDNLSNKVKELFLNNKEIAFKCRYLATLERNANIDISISDVKIGEPDNKELIIFFTKMEFNQFLKKIKSENVYSNQIKESEKHELSDDLESITGDSYIITEVFGSNYYKGEFLGLGVFCNNKKYFVTVDNLGKIKNYLENPSYQKYTFDCKILYFIMQKNNIDLKGVVFDLLLFSYLINPVYANDDFKITIENFENVDLPYYDNIYGANTKMMIPQSDIYINYSINKCLLLKELSSKVTNELIKNEVEYLGCIEMELSKVLADIELKGLKIDLKRLKEIGDDLNEKALSMQNTIYEKVGEEFNINSPKQLGDILFEKLKLPHGKKNKTGYSTSSDVLDKLANEYEIVHDILEYRGYTKLVSTYVKGIQDIEIGSFIHPLYKQALTTTGRLSSIEPNIQNMPIRTEKGQVIREIFVSRFVNGKILSADYSQIELRVLAHMSQDPKMIEAFNSHVDIHTQTASQIYEVPVEEVTKDMRRAAKTINFGIIYGMSPWGLSESLKITAMEANIFINKYFYNFSKAKECLDNFIKEAKENGYSKTLFGRKRYLPELNDKNGMIRSFGERTAMNSPIQGTAADIIKIAMNKIHKIMKEKELKSIMIAQVHDELVFDCYPEEIEIMKKLVKETMEGVVKLDVPLEASCGIGSNWFDTK